MERIDYSKHYDFKQTDREDVRNTVVTFLSMSEHIRKLMNGSEKITKPENAILQGEMGKLEITVLEQMTKLIEVDNTLIFLRRENMELKDELKRLREDRPFKYKEKSDELAPIIDRKEKSSDDKRDNYSIVLEGAIDKDMDIRGVIRNELKQDKKILKFDDIITTRANKLVLKAEKKEELLDFCNWISEREDIRDKVKYSQPSRKTGRVLLLGISSETTEQIITDDIRGILMNEESFVKPFKPIRRRDGLLNWIVDVDMDTRRELLDKNKMIIDMMRIRIVEYIRILRCFKCQGLGHISTGCTRDTRCGKCSEKHDTRACTSNIELCVNCTENTEHRSDSYTCPVYVKFKKEKLAKRL